MPRRSGAQPVHALHKQAGETVTPASEAAKSGFRRHRIALPRPPASAGRGSSTASNRKLPQLLGSSFAGSDMASQKDGELHL